MAYYKFLTGDGTAPYSNVGWHLPADGQPGEWMPVTDNGYHGCREQDLLYWLNASLYELEFDQAAGVVVDGDKVVGRRARLLRRVDTWNERTAFLFAADCGEHVLPLFEQRYPNDPRPRQAIAVTRARAAFAGDAAGDAGDAWDAAWDAATAAAWAATADAAVAAAGDARAASWDAPEAAWATRAAAWDAERCWQQQRLMAYLRGEVGRE